MNSTPLPMRTIFTPRVDQPDVPRPYQPGTESVYAGIIVATLGALGMLDAWTARGVGTALVVALTAAGAFAWIQRLLRPRTVGRMALNAWPLEAAHVRALVCIHQALEEARADMGASNTPHIGARIRWSLSELGPWPEAVTLHTDNRKVPRFFYPTGALMDPVPWNKPPKGPVQTAEIMEALHGTSTIVYLSSLSSAHAKMAFAAWVAQHA